MITWAEFTQEFNTLYPDTRKGNGRKKHESPGRSNGAGLSATSKGVASKVTPRSGERNQGGSMNFEKIIDITIHPGDLGTKLHFFRDPASGRYNRTVTRDKVREYSQILDHIAQNGLPLYLVRNGKANSYFVFDGQHRVQAASERDKPTTFKAIVISDDGGDITEALLGAHETKRFTIADRFFVSQHLSPWPAISERLGLRTCWSGRGTALAWPSIICGRIYADRIHSRHGFGFNQLITTTQQMDEWKHADPNRIEKTVKALLWWDECVSAYSELLGRATKLLRSGKVLGIAIAIFESNEFSRLQHSSTHIMNSRNADMLADLQRCTLPEMANRIVQGINFGRKNTSPLASLYKITGR